MLQSRRAANQRAYRRFRKKIDQQFPPGQYAAIVAGEVVAHAPTFAELIAI